MPLLYRQMLKGYMYPLKVMPAALVRNVPRDLEALPVITC
jgi:hypothetical protein